MKISALISKSLIRRCVCSLVFLLPVGAIWFAQRARAASGPPITITTFGVTVTQNFATLAATGTSGTLPTGWALSETGANTNTEYTAGNGGLTTGDTYSYGTTGETDRAFGTLQSSSLISTIGVCFNNQTNGTITSLAINYTGEQWRLGATGRADRLDFQYSTDATTLTNGTWQDVDQLDFTSPVTSGAVGALNGNTTPNRTAISFTISNLTIANGTTFVLRWVDFNASGSDDGLAVDDFSLTPSGTNGSFPALTINDVSVNEGASGATAANFTVSLSAAANMPVVFDIATQDGTATIADNDYQPRSLTAQTIPPGMTSYQFTVNVNGDTRTEPSETFNVAVATVSGAQVMDGQGLGVIVNDDNAPVPIHDIQGAGTNSPYANQSVTTRGVVTGVRSIGFFIQTPDAETDADPNTSEGIFVHTASPVPAAAVVGNLVSVTGQVIEFRPSADPLSPSFTEFNNGPTVTVLASGQSLPAPTTLTAADTNPAGGINVLERFEGMRVRVNSLTVVAPTEGTVNEVNATGGSSGVFYGVVNGLPRPMREPGLETPDVPPAGAPPNIPVFDANPERLRVDSDSLAGATRLTVTAGATVSNMIGVLDYGSRVYTVLPEPATVPVVTGNLAAQPVPTPETDEFTVVSANLQRFYDDVDDTGGDVILTATAFQNRLRKASLMVRNVLRLPDIIGVQEVENLNALTALATRVNADAIAAGQGSPNYVAFLQEGNDVGLIDVGFLVKTARVSVVDVTQVGKTATYTEPGGTMALLNDRPPLVLRANVQAACGGALPVTIIVNHFRSLLGLDDPTDGARVRAKRGAQGEFLANLIKTRQAADPNERILAVGDFNSFQFSDGYVDPLGAAKGTPIAADQVVLASNDLLSADLANLVEEASPEQRYSYVFNGNAQAIDHALVTQNLRGFFNRLHYGRVNADFPESFRSDVTRPERISDHDPLVAYFKLTSVSSRQISANDFGETRDLEVVAPAGCAWTATSNDSWLTVTNGASGTGNGTVMIRADKSFLTETRTGALNVAGRSVSVTQAASREFCPNQITPTLLREVSANGGGGTISVRGCSWTAVSNNPWITITAGASGVGAGTVTFSVEPNTNATRRGTITVAGKTFTVKQNPR